MVSGNRDILTDLDKLGVTRIVSTVPAEPEIVEMPVKVSITAPDGETATAETVAPVDIGTIMQLAKEMLPEAPTDEDVARVAVELAEGTITAGGKKAASRKRRVKEAVAPEPHVEVEVPEMIVTPARVVGDAVLHHGRCEVVMAMFPPDSIDAIVCDPPYGLSKEPDIVEVLTHWIAGDDYHHTGGGFMGKTWDSFVPGPSIWREAYRVLKPGGHALVFAATKNVDLVGIALRMAGFEVRDSLWWMRGGDAEGSQSGPLMWVYGSGFP